MAPVRGWLLVYPPLLGPAVLAPLAAALRRRGHDVAVPVPGRWPADDVRYVQLSPAYEGEAAAARARGWPVLGSGDGAHLDVANHPERVADLLR